MSKDTDKLAGVLSVLLSVGFGVWSYYAYADGELFWSGFLVATSLGAFMQGCYGIMGFRS